MEENKMSASIYRGHEGFVYLEDTDAQNPNIPDSGIVDDESSTAANLVGRIEGFTIKLDNAVEAYYGIGDRDPTDIKEGNRSVTGTLNRAIINGALLNAALGTGSGTTPNTITKGAVGAYKMKIRLYTSATQYVWLTVTSVKFSTWSLESLTNAGDTVMENLEWLGIMGSAKAYGAPAAGI